MQHSKACKATSNTQTYRIFCKVRFLVELRVFVERWKHAGWYRQSERKRDYIIFINRPLNFTSSYQVVLYQDLSQFSGFTSCSVTPPHFHWKSKQNRFCLDEFHSGFWCMSYSSILEQVFLLFLEVDQSLNSFRCKYWLLDSQTLKKNAQFVKGFFFV